MQLLQTVAVLVSLALAGCNSAPKHRSVSRVDAAPVVQAQAGKDAAITESAGRIEVAVAGEVSEPVVKVETAAIRQAIAVAPAADVAKLATAFGSTLDTLQKQNTALLGQLEEERTRALRDQVKWLNLAGIALLGAFGLSTFFGGLVAMAKTWPLLVLAGGCFGLAQVVGHPWFLRGFLGVGALGIGYGVYWVIDRHKQGRLREAVQKRADLLKQVVPVLDDAYEDAEESVKKALDSKIFSRLSSLMSKDEKKIIHEARAG